MWCYICEKDIPEDDVIGDDAKHCAEGQHCTSQAPECGVDQGPGRDHEKPFRCCACKEMVS